MLKPLWIFFALTFSAQAFAEAAQQIPLPTGSIIATESMTKMIISLVLVLIIIFAIAWLLKRFAVMPTATTSHLKVVSTAGVGQRERVVIVEVGETWLVLGVAQGQINMLHNMEKPALDSSDKTQKNVSAQFSEALNKSISKNTKN